jgi:hypothetical protein
MVCIGNYCLQIEPKTLQAAVDIRSCQVFGTAPVYDMNYMLQQYKVVSLGTFQTKSLLAACSCYNGGILAQQSQQFKHLTTILGLKQQIHCDSQGLLLPANFSPEF